MEGNREKLVEHELYRKLLPLIHTQFSGFREKHAVNDEGFVMELKRLNVLDESEMRRMTHAYFLPKIPCLVWLLEWTVSFQFRDLYAGYGIDEFVGDFPYVVMDPYAFLGHLFQTIARQWLNHIQEKRKIDMPIYELDAFLRTCLKEQLEASIPVVPYFVLLQCQSQPGANSRSWYQKCERVHKRLWNLHPEIRPYIRFHEAIFRQYSSNPHDNSEDERDTTTTERSERSRRRPVATIPATVQNLAPPPPPPPTTTAATTTTLTSAPPVSVTPPPPVTIAPSPPAPLPTAQTNAPVLATSFAEKKQASNTIRMQLHRDKKEKVGKLEETADDNNNASSADDDDDDEYRPETYRDSDDSE